MFNYKITGLVDGAKMPISSFSNSKTRTETAVGSTHSWEVAL